MTGFGAMLSIASMAKEHATAAKVELWKRYFAGRVEPDRAPRLVEGPDPVPPDLLRPRSAWKTDDLYDALDRALHARGSSA
jgi:hypothetical protein